MERKQQIGQALTYAVRNGDLSTERNGIKIFIRDWVLWLLQLVPSWKFKLEQVPLSPPHYTYETGMAFIPELGEGRSLPQVYCTPMSSPEARREVLYSDDVIFSPGKRSLFQ